MATFEEISSAQKASGNAGTTYDGKTPYTAQTFQPATSQADQINTYYDQYLDSQKLAQQNAYQSSMKAAEYEASKLPQQYKTQREALAADTEIARKNFQESAAARGLNVGAGSQYALSTNNQYLKNMTTLRQAEMQAMADVEEKRRQTTADYQNAVAEAISNGNLQRAKALYDEAVRVDESILSTARAQAQENYNAWQSAYTLDRARKEDEQTEYNRNLDRAETLAQYGDFSGYLALGYSQSQVDAMRALWLQQMYGTGGSGGGSSGGSRSSGSSSKKSSGSSGTTTKTTSSSSSSSGMASFYTPKVYQTPTTMVTNPGLTQTGTRTLTGQTKLKNTTK